MIETVGKCPECGKEIKTEYSFNEQGETEHIIDCPYCKFYEHFAYGAHYGRSGYIK